MDIDTVLDPVIAKCMKSKIFTFCGGVLGFGLSIFCCCAVPYVLKFPRYNTHLVLLFLLGGVGFSLGCIFTNKFFKLIRPDEMATSDSSLPYFSHQVRGRQLGNFTESSLNYFSQEIWEPRPLRKLTKTTKLPISPEINDAYFSHRRKKPEPVGFQTIPEECANSSNSSASYSPVGIEEPRLVQFQTLKSLQKPSESRLSYFSNPEKEQRPVRRQKTTDKIPKWMLRQKQEEELQENLLLFRDLERKGNSKSSEEFKIEGCRDRSSSSSSENSFTSSDESSALKSLKSLIRRNSSLK
ncbi:uncharacterized protein TNIN_429571 [Trichonephila inaurata madagascariensis]|uniref:Uncharacterized protein n=1 Tax=Trichonephila inaurata madagascariensis TaxID=2747483 RepID=A0A8X6YG71_9ARAC|nr:uncharacterized protein TNIN_429571 [Trichonephila inaurata madagascariensis]